MPKYRTRVAAKQAFMEAPDFTVFQPVHFEQLARRGRGGGWDLFMIDNELSPKVEAILEMNGIYVVDFEPQRDDATASQRFDDFDAAIEALGDNFWLCKVPDSLTLPRSQHFRLYTLRAIHPPAQIRVGR